MHDKFCTELQRLFRTLTRNTPSPCYFVSTLANAVVVITWALHAGSGRCWIEVLERGLEWTACIGVLISEIVEAGRYNPILVFLLISDRYPISISDQDTPNGNTGVFTRLEHFLTEEERSQKYSLFRSWNLGVS